MQKMKDLLNEELKKMRKEFYEYFNLFYGVDGIYPSGRNISDEELDFALEHLNHKHKKQYGVDYPFYGDSLNREHVRDVVFTEEEMKKMYGY